MSGQKKEAENDSSLKELRRDEEERLVQFIATRGNYEYTDYNVAVEPDALLLVSEEDAKEAVMAAFKKNSQNNTYSG